MNNYAVIRAAGKQYTIQVGDIIKIDGQIIQEKQLENLFEVLLYHGDDSTLVGKPIVKNVLIKSKILDSFRDKKVKVQKFKSKVRYRLNKSHRQLVSRIKIDKIDLLKTTKIS